MSGWSQEAHDKLTAYRGSNPYLHKRWEATSRLFWGEEFHHTNKNILWQCCQRMLGLEIIFGIGLRRVLQNPFQRFVFLAAVGAHIEMPLDQGHEVRHIYALNGKFRKLIEQGKDFIAS